MAVMEDLFTHARSTCRHVDADQWLLHLFSADAAAKGAVVRRKAVDVERIVGWRRFRHELRRRGYRGVVNGGQVVIFCNAEPLRMLD
jgi:hypothetical protein